MSTKADVSTDRHYHQQPHTLDPTKDDLPEDAPRAQGHKPDDAADVAKADAEHTQTVKDEADADEVTARAPGDHAGSDKKAEKTDKKDTKKG